MYMPKNSLFNINKFCDPSYQRSKISGQTNQLITCNPVEYNKVKTATNDPSISSKMRYSQLVKSSRYKQVPPQQNAVTVFDEQKRWFSFGQIKQISSI